MALIRKIEIENFRGIKHLSWQPSDGINCLIGHGDSGKSTILDAIDIALTSRRTTNIYDTDFFDLDIDNTISITLTLGALGDALKNYEAYGDFHRGFDASTGELEDEPSGTLETVLVLQLAVEGDLEPKWTLLSDRAEAKGITRSLKWSDRNALAPTRLGGGGDFNLSWRRGSVLDRLSDVSPNAASTLVDAARQARETFGDQAEDELHDTLRLVEKTASGLGVPIGERAKALLDAHSVSFSGGTIALHDGSGIPLRNLGLGSTRLLIAGLQSEAAKSASIVLVDEIEHGLEPHRIIRFLGSLGAKKDVPPMQVFTTSHSPVALKELSAAQLFVVRPSPTGHAVKPVPNSVQGTLRAFPEAFLANSVIVCEGATEVGFLRGLDQRLAEREKPTLAAHGVAMADCGGGDSNRPYTRGLEFLKLGYRVAVFRDSDVAIDAKKEAKFTKAGGRVFRWADGLAIEDAIFRYLDVDCITDLMAHLADTLNEQLIDDHIKSASNGSVTVDIVAAELETGILSESTRELLGRAANIGQWFKSISKMEEPTRNIISHRFNKADKEFKAVVRAILEWGRQSNE